jgi:dolichol kinase
MVTGQIGGAVIERNGKRQVLESILKAEGFASEDCVVVADDRNNAPMFLPKTLKIGYSPDFVVRMKADHVVTGNPQEILSLMSGQEPAKRRTPSANEIVREVIHAGGFAVPFITHAIGLSRIAFLILLVTVLYVVSEFMMVEKKSLPVISSITRRAATLQELHEFGAAPIFFAVGILLTLIIFPTPASSAAVAIFTIGDSTASIFGKMFGKTELSFNKGKTLEGSLIGLASAFLAATIFVSPLKAFAGALVAMVIESLPLPLNDNLIVPLAAAVTLTLIA